MAKFTYRMQNILDIKMKMEETAKQEYAQAVANLQKEEAVLQTLVLRRQEYYHAYQDSIQGKLDFLVIEENANAMDIMDLQIQQQEDVIRDCSKQVELARQKMAKEMQERKMHEKLKEKKFAQFLVELNETEKRETDEVAGYMFLNTEKEG